MNKLSLGTVQFGMPYGIANLSGRVSEKEVGSILGVDMTTFCFHSVKTLTSGEGGMVTTNSDPLAEEDVSSVIAAIRELVR